MIIQFTIKHMCLLFGADSREFKLELESTATMRHLPNFHISVSEYFCYIYTSCSWFELPERTYWLPG